MIYKNTEDIFADTLLILIVFTCFSCFLVNWNHMSENYSIQILFLFVLWLIMFAMSAVIGVTRRKQIRGMFYSILTIIVGTIIAIIGFMFSVKEVKLVAPYPDLLIPQPGIPAYPNLVAGTIILVSGIIIAVLGKFLSQM